MTTLTMRTNQMTRGARPNLGPHLDAASCSLAGFDGIGGHPPVPC